MSNSLDLDYATVAARRPAGERRRSKPSAPLTVAVVVAVFGVMIAVSAVRTWQQRPAAAAERAQLVSQIHARQHRLDALHAQLGTLETTVGSLQKSTSDALARERALTGSILSLGGIAGTGAVTGPGVSILTDDARGSSATGDGVILDTDLQTLVNALWSAGAEAISINGHRLTSQTAIRFAGQAITVDYRSLTPPYTIEAIGDPATMPADLSETAGGQAWQGLHENFGIEYQVSVEQSMTLAGDASTDLQHAQASEGR